MSSGAITSCQRPLGSKSEDLRPLVSVIIPTYNSARYLTEAVDSVFHQTYTALECIVVDDGSTDHTHDILTKLLARYPRLKTAHKPNGGPSSARNLGLRSSSGDFVSFVDADDVLLADKIERQLGFLSAHPDVGLVYSDYLVVSENLQPLATFVAEMPPALDSVDALCYRNWFNPLVTLLRRSLIDTIGGFDEALAVAEDWDYWIRCASVAPIAYLPGPVALYRQHAGQLYRDHFRMQKASLQVAKKNFRENPARLRAVMAGVEWTHAKYLWRNRDIVSSCAALVRCALRERLGLHKGPVLRQLAALIQSQLRPLSAGELEPGWINNLRDKEGLNGSCRR